MVIEDTITTGGSARKAVDAVRAAGGTVVGVLALVDREEGGREALEAATGSSASVLARPRELSETPFPTRVESLQITNWGLTPIKHDAQLSNELESYPELSVLVAAHSREA